MEQIHLISRVAEFFGEQGLTGVPKCKRAVPLAMTLVQPRLIRTGWSEVRTLWGELAWQLGGAETYDLLKESDLV